MTPYPNVRKLARMFSAIAILGGVLVAVAVAFGLISHWLDGEATSFVLAAGSAGLLVRAWLRWRALRLLDQLS